MTSARAIIAAANHTPTQALPPAKEIYAIGSRPAESRKSVGRYLSSMAVMTIGFAAGMAVLNADPVASAAAKAIQRLDQAIGDALRSVGQAEAPAPAPGGPVWIKSDNSSWTVAAELSSEIPTSADHSEATSRISNKADDSLTPEADFARLRDVFSDRGMNADQARLVIAHMSGLQDAWVLGSPNPELYEHATGERQKHRDWLAQAWKDGRHIDVDSAATDDFAQLSFPDPVADDVWSNMNEGSRWSALEKAWMHAASASTPRNSINTDMLAVTVECDKPAQSKDIAKFCHYLGDLDRARTELADTVKDVGLAALRVPLQIESSPIDLRRLSRRLRQSNDDLQEVTGLAGGVLGLNGRVILDLAHRDDGTAEILPTGYIRLKCSWGTLGHEWLHALDYAQATSMLRYSRPRATLSRQQDLPANPDPALANIRATGTTAQLRLWSGIHHPDLSPEQRKQIVKIAEVQAFTAEDGLPSEVMFRSLTIASAEAPFNMPDKGSPWLSFRERAAAMSESRGAVHHRGANYLRSPTEILAFSFEGHLRQTFSTGQTPLLPDPIGNPSSIAYEPTVIESKAAAMAWDNYFKAVQPWFMDDSQRRQPDPSQPKNTTRPTPSSTSPDR